jgi:serine/threonine-protein kinase RsbW
MDDTLGNYTISAVDLNMLILAVDEVCANLIVHSVEDQYVEDCIRLNIYVDAGHIQFEVIDFKETGFDLSNYKEPDLEALIKARRKGGLGLLLVKKIMDDVEFSSNATSNMCRMTKNLPVEAV